MHRSTRCSAAFLVLLTAVCCALPARAQTAPLDQPDPGILWRHDLDEAMQRSKSDGKPVIAFFTFDTCVWCHKLEADTFTDASVIEMSRKFHWVQINRDVTPEICQRLNVSAYPSLITFGDRQEKVHRFSGYMLPDAFKERLADALRRYDLYQAGKEWDDPQPRPESICDAPGVTIETCRAPSEEVPAGFAFLGDSMWVAHMGSLYECDLAGKVKRTFALDNSVLDICTDGVNLYAMTSGWTAGQPIYVIDPTNGRTTRSIITQANKANQSYGAKGIEYIDGHLDVLEGMNGIIHRVDPATGDITRSVKTQNSWLTGLAWDGQHYITGSRDSLLFFDDTGTRIKAIPVNYPLRSVGWKAGAEGKDPGSIYLMEQPIFDFDKDNQQIRLWPRETLIYRLQFDQQKAAAPSPRAAPFPAPAPAPAPALGSRENPILCDMPTGERAYLNRLRCNDGSRREYIRVGSYGAGPDGHILDGYKVTCGSNEFMIFMDMYHPNHVEADAVPGFTILDR